MGPGRPPSSALLQMDLQPVPLQQLGATPVDVPCSARPKGRLLVVVVLPLRKQHQRMLRAEVPLVDVALALALGPLVGQDPPPRRVQTSRLLACPRAGARGLAAECVSHILYLLTRGPSYRTTCSYVCMCVCRGSVCSPLSSYDFVFLKFGASRLTCVSGTLRLSNVVLRPQLPTPLSP